MTQGVKWLVFEQPVAITETDINNIGKAIRYYPDTISLPKYNYSSYRPIQPLNARVVRKFEFKLDNIDEVIESLRADEDEYSKPFVTAAFVLGIIGTVGSIVACCLVVAYAVWSSKQKPGYLNVNRHDESTQPVPG